LGLLLRQDESEVGDQSDALFGKDPEFEGDFGVGAVDLEAEARLDPISHVQTHRVNGVLGKDSRVYANGVVEHLQVLRVECLT